MHITDCALPVWHHAMTMVKEKKTAKARHDSMAQCKPYTVEFVSGRVLTISESVSSHNPQTAPGSNALCRDGLCVYRLTKTTPQISMPTATCRPALIYA